MFVIFIFAAGAFAQSGAYTPAKGSPERAAILAALRVPVERELKQKIQFSVDNFKVEGNWAFLSGTPQNASGDKPNYKGTPYQSAVENGVFGNNFFGLLRKTGGRWRVVRYQIGCTDVCYLGWDNQYKAPKAIFPNGE